MNDAVWTVVERLEGFAAEHGHSLLELAFGWLLSRRPVASVIAGATTPEQVAANVQAAASWRLTADEMREVDRLTR
jgi:aryl-alcohol dehydrogenase-like predicted oxidoreductase